MRQLAMEINGGYWVFPGDPQFTREESPPPRKVVNSAAGVDDLVKRLGEILVAMSRLGHDDQKRMTNFILAAGSLSLAKTRLEPGDQKMFEAALRTAAKQQRGG
jgi:hypothetical protein